MSDPFTFSPVTLITVLKEVPDPRIERGKKFSLLEILLTAICAVLAGSETWNEIQDDAEELLDWFREELGLELKNGIPSHDTYRRVFSLMDPLEFQKAFIQWVQGVNEILQGQVIAIDGKTLRRAIQNGEQKSSIHLISAWASENGLVLGQMKSEGKANEIRTIPKFLDLLKVRGCIVSTDAMGCQTEVAEKILEKDADYLLAVKGNQDALHEEIQAIFTQESVRCTHHRKAKHHETHEKAHGREETRRYDCLSKHDARNLGHLDIGNRWPKLQSICRVISTRKTSRGETTATRYYISSTPADAKKQAQAIRAHWGVENDVHWVLDVEFREDESRMRKENSPVNFGMIRRLALNILRAEPSKRSLKRKRRRCYYHPEFLVKVLTNQAVGLF